MFKNQTFETTASGTPYSLHYKIWGENNPRTLVCAHGLTGNSDDFKFVGESLSAQGFRVVAIDMAGRGLSSYYSNPDDYNFDQYINDLNLLLKKIGCTSPSSCDWLGVSMGGLLGLRLAGIPNSPIHRLILSDIGAEVPQFDLDFISKVIKLTPEYNNPADAIPILKMSTGTPYSRGPLDEDQWLYMASVALKKRDDGKYIRNFDANIAFKFDTEPLGKEDLWGFWEKTSQPTLALRGELSTLFPLRIADAMKTRKPNDKYTMVTIAGAGHVPSLFRDDQIKIISDWLTSTL
jgi:pimeloyl-ACP methyl ester carboxylesterase